MGSKVRIGPQPRQLTEPLESIQAYEVWKYSVLYSLRQEPDFKPFLIDGLVFGAKTALAPSRRLTDDPTGTQNRKSKEDKCAIVDFLLDTIAQYCPKIPHNDIVNDCASLEEVWQVIRLHSNIETSGALLNDIWNITRQPDETPQALYSRIKQAYDDNHYL